MIQSNKTDPLLFLPLMKRLCKQLSGKKIKTIKTGKELFQSLLVSREAGSDINLEEILKTITIIDGQALVHTVGRKTKVKTWRFCRRLH